ncbi:hypothetical protein BDN70DRAFT_885645 [Pholiota conissans]|uniref:Brr2 N-terminal helicase PWI domain-containing protein n=1 Tax=Pholiota conissans TaxID=109636 RepID=A0A9P6CNL5_9AGAR|nr:hypothetical protein BDN70DRAFT_885645 [Pholiota conissans]
MTPPPKRDLSGYNYSAISSLIFSPGCRLPLPRRSSPSQATENHNGSEKVKATLLAAPKLPHLPRQSMSSPSAQHGNSTALIQPSAANVESLTRIPIAIDASWLKHHIATIYTSSSADFLDSKTSRALYILSSTSLNDREREDQLMDLFDYSNEAQAVVAALLRKRDADAAAFGLRDVEHSDKRI